MDNFIRFRCGKCGKSLKAPPEHAGKRSVCACGAKMLVPGNEELVQAIADDEPDAPARRRHGLMTTLSLTILLPLIVTVAGGLAVEYLKPRDSAPAPPNAAAAPAPVIEAQRPPGAIHPNARLLIGKWNSESSGVLFGEYSVEFTKGGQILRKHQEGGFECNDRYSYTVDNAGNFSANPAGVQLVQVTDSELVLVWDVATGKRQTTYSRPWSKWLIGIAIGAFCILAVLGKMLESKLK